jgi:hypothetical protein
MIQNLPGIVFVSAMLYATSAFAQPPGGLAAPNNDGVATQSQSGGTNIINPQPALNSITGWQIIGNQPGAASAIINSTGTSNSPSNGAVVNVKPQPGQSATGVSIIQNAPGTGLIINQSGPGTGLTINVGQ